MKNNEYWGKRLADRVYDNNSKDMLKALRKIYRQQSKEIKHKITNLFADMLGSGEISTTQLYSYGRYTELLREINKVLNKYGDKEEKVIHEGLERAYKDTFGKTSEELGQPIKWGLQNTEVMKEAVNTSFKGTNWSSRIWKNRERLGKKLEKGIQDVVASGMSKDKAVKEIMRIERTAFSNADRLVRTETMRVINDGQKKAYINAGRTHGYYIFSDDDRNCEECERIAKESRANPLPLEEMEAVHHPNCRCTIRPVVKMKTLNEYIKQTYKQ